MAFFAILAIHFSDMLPDDAERLVVEQAKAIAQGSDQPLATGLA